MQPFLLSAWHLVFWVEGAPFLVLPPEESAYNMHSRGGLWLPLSIFDLCSISVVPDHDIWSFRWHEFIHNHYWQVRYAHPIEYPSLNTISIWSIQPFLLSKSRWGCFYSFFGYANREVSTPPFAVLVPTLALQILVLQFQKLRHFILFSLRDLVPVSFR